MAHRQIYVVWAGGGGGVIESRELHSSRVGPTHGRQQPHVASAHRWPGVGLFCCQEAAAALQANSHAVMAYDGGALCQSVRWGQTDVV